MKKKRFTEEQIVRILKEYEAGRSTKELCRENGITTTTFYNWRKKYAGMEINQLKRLKELEEENRRLKHMYAELALDNTMLKDVLSKKW
jgi:putative transposase